MPPLAVKMAGRWVLEVDIRKFFDTLDHRQLRSIVRKRVRDGVLLRLIGKWLNAGVMEDRALAVMEVNSCSGYDHQGLADSKLLTAKRREALFAVIADCAVAIGLGRSEVDEVDRINVYWAAMEARRRARPQTSRPARQWPWGRRPSRPRSMQTSYGVGTPRTHRQVPSRELNRG
jgi:hypothetical protein